MRKFELSPFHAKVMIVEF